jgi:acyl-CoA reductase-like NAD-dependent aldehyde dehydrogenase
MPLALDPGLTWSSLSRELRSTAPECFDPTGNLLNLVRGEWSLPGRGRPVLSPVDGSLLGHLPMLEVEVARDAVRHAAEEARAWAGSDLDERRRKVLEAVDAIDQHRELFARLLAWEIGKPLRQARVSAERTTAGVRYYLTEVERMLGARAPLGLVSNIASWNYPLSVLVHSVLVQVLVGNGVIAKTPSEGGAHALSLAFALMRRTGLPVSLVSGSGAILSDALVRAPEIACVFFVGGRATGRNIAASLHDPSRRAILEMEGLNAFGVWQYSDWASLAAMIKKGFEYGKQRCTAYPRFVVQRSLVPQFIETYVSVASALRIGHPLLGPDAESLDFGPLITPGVVDGLHAQVAEAEGRGAVRLYQGRLSPERFLPEQDTSAYMAPVLLMHLPRNAALYHAEPFGPVDSLVVVDSVAELVSEMNVSNGSLVSSVLSDDEALATQLARDVRAFKVGINRVRSRGDKEEVFGGLGASWVGPFVGGELLVRALSSGGAGERLPGNYSDGILLPDKG